MKAKGLLYKIYMLCTRPVKGWFYMFVFLLNLVSNYVVTSEDNMPFTYFSVFFLSAFVAYIESAIYVVLTKKSIKQLYVVLITLLHSILIACEYFLLFRFNSFLNQGIVNIIGETNREEAQSFINTYLPPIQILVVLVLLAALLTIIYGLSILISKTRYTIPAFLFSLTGLGLALYGGYGFLRYRDGMSIPQHTTLTRLGYSIYQLKQKNSDIVLLRDVCKNVEASAKSSDLPTIIVIIGESHSVYHTSLYGYEKATNPLLAERVKDGSMVVFDNAVTLHDATSASMAADFSLNALGVDFATTPLFPACFKAAGYRTVMYDNQYSIGSGISFLSDKELSDILFDYRNTREYQYDGDMVDDIEMSDSPTLYIIHLQGQHFDYEADYPQSFGKFRASDYDKKYNEDQRATIAHYDNATLYNDYVIDKIIKKFEHTNCCVFYFPDHGEEIYELRNYMGHGNAESSPDLNYQIRIPLLVWLSPTFTAGHPSLRQRLEEAKHYPICADDIGHTLLDVAGISTSAFSPSRSFVNVNYDKNRHRIVLHSIDYDEYQDRSNM